MFSCSALLRVFPTLNAAAAVLHFRAFADYWILQNILAYSIDLYQSVRLSLSELGRLLYQNIPNTDLYMTDHVITPFTVMILSSGTYRPEQTV